MLRMLKAFSLVLFCAGLLAGVYLIPTDSVNSDTGDSPLYVSSLNATTQHISGENNGRSSAESGTVVSDFITCEVTCGPTCNQTTCGVTCVETCEFTCTNTCEQATCTATCVATCEATCANTCEQPTCASTCVVTCSFTCNVPITLASFTASAESDNVTVEWTTGSEIDTYCFMIYRAAERDGEYSVIADYIPAEGGTVTTSYSFVDRDVQMGQTYYYQLADITKYGWETRHEIIASATPGTQIGSAASYLLAENFPNPFNAETTIQFSVPAAGHVELAVYDLNGRRVTTLVDGYRSAGADQVVWDASNFAAGVYVYRLTTGGQTAIGKMIYMK